MSGQWSVLPADVHGSIRDELFADSGECELDGCEKCENVREVSVSGNDTRSA